MENIEVVKVPSPKCPRCGSEHVFVFRSHIVCDDCEKETAGTSDFIKEKKNKTIKLLLEDIGDCNVGKAVGCL